jgi:hypothetical protein
MQQLSNGQPEDIQTVIVGTTCSMRLELTTRPSLTPCDHRSVRNKTKKTDLHPFQRGKPQCQICYIYCEIPEFKYVRNGTCISLEVPTWNLGGIHGRPMADVRRQSS